jgi:uncharacterized protein YndB with AHSA1/START domain
MEKMKFSTAINAPKEKVWETLWDEEKYKAWTGIFAEGSYAVTDNWKEGTKVLFLDPKGNGIASIVAANRPFEFMSFRHIGMLKEGVEDKAGDAVNSWAGAMENYTLAEVDGKTRLEVEMDTTEEYKDYFLKTWPAAMEKIKELAEGSSPLVITVETMVDAPVEKVWECWSKPEHITQWNQASDDWHTPWAKNDLRTGGSFVCRMEAKDGSMGFDFGGVYDAVKEHEYIAYTMSDGRKAEVYFAMQNGKTKVTESFEAEHENSPELQRSGWQAILDNFRKYAEHSNR